MTAATPTPRPRRALLACVLLTLLPAVLVGCASSGKGDYLAQYSAGQFGEAYKGASRQATQASSVETREQARLIAGLSAHAMNRAADAERWLKPLVNSRDRQIAGRANAALGLIEAKRNNHAGAAAYLSKAATQLTGDDAARAGLHAGDAYAAMGRAEQARLQYNLAFGSAADAGLKSTLAARLDKAGYTVQLGAFATRDNAERTARTVASKSVGFGYGEPKIVQSMDARGRPLYLVQAGIFRTKADADAARRRLGDSAIVASASE